jgi:hypothetical protein
MMTSVTGCTCLLLAALSLLSACSSKSSGGAGGGGGGGGAPAPTLTITSPKDGATFTLDFAKDVTDIEGTVAATNFKIAAKGKGDGQVFILVDGAKCNDTAMTGERLPYNTTVPSLEKGGVMDGKTFEAGIDYCDGAPANIVGKHTITAELHADDGSPIQVDGKTVSATPVSVEVKDQETP